MSNYGKAACCLIFAIAMSLFVWNGKYLLVVTPSMKWYLYFVSAMSCLWAVLLIRQKKRPMRRQSISPYCLLLAITMLLSLPFDAKENVVTLAQIRANSIGNEEAVVQLEPATHIFVTDKTYLYWVGALWSNVHLYEHATITIEGRIQYLEKEKEYVLLRQHMSCCVADAVPVGIVCKFSENKEEYRDCYVKIIGEVMCFHTETQIEPRIYCKQVTKIKASGTEYLF